MKKAFITGITGQDGAYLAQFLLEKGYEVHGMQRRTSIDTRVRIKKIISPEFFSKKFFIHAGDITDSLSIVNLLAQIQPDEIYNLAAQSHVGVSFETPEYTANTDALGVLRILEAIRILGLTKKTKFYQASTSELYGKAQQVPQNELTPFYPRSPYAVAKLYAYWIVVNYREAYNIFACNGILFNHESPVRGEHFVTRKITQAVARIAHGSAEVLYLGNLDAQRDWGYAPEYVHGMWLMLQQEKPEDFVIATGQTHTVREFVESAFKEIGKEIIWAGSGIEEKGFDAQTNKLLVAIDPRYFRPTEVDLLLGDATKAREKLGWQPKISFHELVKIMVQSDVLTYKEGLVKPLILPCPSKLDFA